MSADLIVIDSVDRKPNAHAERRVSEFYVAWQALGQQLEAAGIPTMNSAADAVFMAAFRMADAWQNRARRLEQQLRSALAVDAIPDEAKTGILRALYGKRGTNRRPCSEAEASLLDQYRALDDGTRQMFRTLVNRLSLGVQECEKGGADG